MGTNNLETKNNGDVISHNDPNQYKTAATEDFVPRNSSGVPTDVAGGLGTTLYRWAASYIQKIFLGTASEGCSIENDGDNLKFKIGGVVKALITSAGFDGSYVDPSTGKRLQCKKFQTVGDNAFNFPSDTTYAWAYGGGGGGGGGKGGTGADGFNDGGGGGGGGGASIFTGPYFFDFTAGEAAVARVGAGGAINGGDGEASTITAVAGTFPEIYFPGAEGGDAGPQSSADGVQVQAAGGNLLIYSSHLNSPIANCGPGGAGAYNSGPFMGAASQAPAYKLLVGGTIAAGGAAGAHGNGAPGTDDDHGGGGGGGARSIFANGGAGGNGQNNSGAGLTAGADAEGAMAGGGGGGGGREAGGGTAGANGGAGGRGEIWIYCVTAESWEGTV